MSGRVVIVGLGPGPETLRTAAATAELADATDLVGYVVYLARVPERPGQVRHASDNREEIARARLALSLAASGRRVAVVSSGDPGVFAMASAVFEAMETGEPGWRDIDVEVVPGVTAMLAAAARAGAPLGGDFCAISLSDRLKPWSDVARRLVAAAQAGFAIALYNPASSERPWQFRAALALLRANLPPATPVVFATAIGALEERVETVPLGAADPARADMRTVVLVGSPATRQVGRWVYTPRRADCSAP